MKYLILFDGICNLCNSTVKFVIKHDQKEKFKFASLQSEFGINFLKERNLSINHWNSIILYEPNKAYYIKSTAALKIALQMGFPYNLLYIFIILPTCLRNIVYDYIAKNRYKWFGKKDQCMIPTPELKKRFIV